MATVLTAALFLIQNPPISICPDGGGGVRVAREAVSVTVHVVFFVRLFSIVCHKSRNFGGVLLIFLFCHST